MGDHRIEEPVRSGHE